MARDERIEALRLAVSVRRSTDSTEDTVNRAKEFDKFLSNEPDAESDVKDNTDDKPAPEA